MNDEGQNIDVWSEVWESLSIESEIQMWDYYGLRPWIIKYTPRSGKILEAGCGLGRYNFYLSHFGINMIGLDFSSISISSLNKWGIQNGYDIPFIEGDVTHLPFIDNTLSGYLSFGVIEHFIDGPSIPLSEALRVLRPGGIAIITTPNHTWSKKVKRTIYSIKRAIKFLLGYENKKKVFFQYEYSPNQLKKIIEKSGLKVTENTGTDFLYTFTEIGKRPSFDARGIPWYFRLSEIIDSSFLKKFGAQSITISVKTAEKMHCFFCGEHNAGMISLKKYIVPVCDKCEDNPLAEFYLKTSKTYFHQSYSVNPPILEPHKQICDFCSREYETHPVFEDFGFNKNACYDCLAIKSINIELSNKNVKPVWRARVK